MGYTKEVLERARQRLAQQRTDAESQTAARLQLAYAQVPRLREIDRDLRLTMAKAAQAAFLQGEDGQAALQRVKAENQALQAERQLLEQTHFAPGYLDGLTVCPDCGGTGYLGSAMCRCLKALCVEEQRKELGAVFSGGESFENFRLEYYTDGVIPQLKLSPRAVMEKNLDTCRRYARAFGADAGNLLMVGGTGLGKTHLALAIGRAGGEQGVSVCYESAATLFAKLEKARFTPSEENSRQVERIHDCDLLIVDDLGTEMPGQFVTAALYALLNQRLMEKKSMVITTNLNVEEAGKRYSNQIASRLYGEFMRLTFLGSDIRVAKSRGEIV